MDIRDALLGKVVLVTTSGLFLLLVVWINIYPFLDEESVISSLVPSPAWALLASAAGGLMLVGGLMAFTLYHVYPHL